MKRSIKGWFGSLTVFWASMAFPIQAVPQEQFDEDLILRQLARVQGEMKDFTADLIQEKKISLLGKTIISHGVIEFKHPNKVRIELFDPDPSLTVVDGSTLWLYFKQERVAHRYEVGNNPELKRYLTILENPFKDEWGKLTSIRKEGDFAVLEVIPAEVETVYSRVILWVSTQNWLVEKLALYEKGGDFTVLSYENIRINTGIPDSHFTLDLPADVEILQPSR